MENRRGVQHRAGESAGKDVLAGGKHPAGRRIGAKMYFQHIRGIRKGNL